MKVAVLANDAQWQELITGTAAVEWIRIDRIDERQLADAIFILDGFTHLQLPIHIPVFVNAVTSTLRQLQLPANVVRLNGWPGFLHRPLWEIAGTVSQAHEKILSEINKAYVVVADEPGLIAARPIAMIINEAYYALGENISTPAEIDTAMKLGTNYPLGPFEWADKIGQHNVYHLLQVLHTTDERYTPAPLLQKAIQS